MNCSAHRLLPQSIDCVPTFFINRDRDRERRNFIEAQLASSSMPAERVRAIDGRNVPAELRHYFLENGRLTSKMSDGEIGCYASHLLAAQTIAARGLPYALIIEDDATLPRSLRHDLQEILGALPGDWDIVQLGTDPTHAFKPIKPLRQGREIVCYSGRSRRLSHERPRCSQVPCPQCARMACRYGHEAALGLRHERFRRCSKTDRA